MSAAVQSAAPVATMQAVTHPLLIRWSMLALASLGACSGACAGTIAGTVSFPSQVVPSMTVYVSDLDTSRIHTALLTRGQVNFAVEVPPGRYLVFLAPNEPGAPDIYGAFTRYSQCAPHAVDDAACADHALIPVAVTAKAPRAAVTIDDWYLTDDIADQLDRIRDAAGDRSPKEPLSAPRFSEYPSESYEAGAPPKIDFGSSEPSQEDRELAEAALAGGPNFAGHVTVTLTSCGTACGRVFRLAQRCRPGAAAGGAARREPGNAAVQDRRGAAISTRQPPPEPDPSGGQCGRHPVLRVESECRGTAAGRRNSAAVASVLCGCGRFRPIMR
jgi:hypothetical protein